VSTKPRGEKGEMKPGGLLKCLPKGKCTGKTKKRGPSYLDRSLYSGEGTGVYSDQSGDQKLGSRSGR